MISHQNLRWERLRVVLMYVCACDPRAVGGVGGSSSPGLGVRLGHHVQPRFGALVKCVFTHSRTTEDEERARRSTDGPEGGGGIFSIDAQRILQHARIHTRTHN